MAKLHGKTGAMYWQPTMTAITIAFVDGGGGADTITDSGNGFVAAGFKDGDRITVSGSTSNNNTFDVPTVAAGTLTLDTGVLTAEIAGDTVTIIHALPGQLLLNFGNWELNYNDDLQDVTDFDSAGISESMLGVTEWNATAGSFWDTNDSQSAWTGAVAKTVYFFELYDDDPDVTTCQYYEGSGLTRVWGITQSKGEVIRHQIELQGTGAITQQTASVAWPVQT